MALKLLHYHTHISPHMHTLLSPWAGFAHKRGNRKLAVVKCDFND